MRRYATACPELGSVSHLPSLPGPETLHLNHAPPALVYVFQGSSLSLGLQGSVCNACSLSAIMHFMH